MGFKGNPILFYDNGVWGKLGFGLPNWGPRATSANSALRDLVEVIGRNLQAMMLHEDARSASPPSLDTIMDINRLVLRARDLISSEVIHENELGQPTVHDTPSKEPFMVFPTPYFFVRNKWMKSYCSLVFSALSEAMQASDNDLTPGIREATGKVIAAPLVKLYKKFCIELLKINPKDPNFPRVQVAMDLTQNPPVPLMQPDWKNFTLTVDQLYAYRPSVWYTPTEMIDTVMPLDDIPTAYELLPVTNGLAVPELPPLGPFPFAVEDSDTDLMPDPATQKPGAVAAPGSGPAPAQAASALVGQVAPGASNSTFP